MIQRKLVLEDGTVFKGEGIGSEKEVMGEVVFNTGMTGYQEIISDPSYCGQIVTLTYPQTGIYGVNMDDFETVDPSIGGLVVKESCDSPSHFRSEQTLDQFLKMKNIPGIQGIDTRKLTKRIRSRGTLKGILTSSETPDEIIVRQLSEAIPPSDQVKQVSTMKPYVVPGRGQRIVLIDYGMKHGILRELTKRNCHVTVVPYDTTGEAIKQLKPDGIMLTNGPGNPKCVPEAIETIQSLIGGIPIFGICLGHQLIALACGADTHPLKFGHRGSNHPVFDNESGRVWMTSQNHGYAVDVSSLQNTELEMNQYALNDGTVEGLRHKRYPVFSVQYHPESSPGPQDSNSLFDRFLTMILEHKRQGVQS
ncbi:carbamoyl-phosphate synthase small subunit [Salinibacillus kushneri]|uniref:Carbamoyl phosphate synthase small chain n=1 Tax=Salinibacillus kushneri TaxID=237682 RepID=A0A1I0HL20_9BACI|nr:carbamoyl phosphate synthase small subunit [Salinibacillus kushneri]SET84686.1 carbamoyl-phosphate synthase small subunit [Salinibacillus kushneri]